MKKIIIDRSVNEHQETVGEINTRLKRALSRADNHFALFFALVNFPEAIAKITRNLRENIKRPIVEITVNTEELKLTTLDAWLIEQLKDAPKNAVVFLYNFAELLPSQEKELQKNLQQINWRRSSLAAIHRPLVIWLPHYAIDSLAEHAPDFYDWYSNVYDYSTDTETHNLIAKKLDAEFSGNVGPAERLSQKEKQKWIQTLKSLLEEHDKKDAYYGTLQNELGRLYKSMGELDLAAICYKKSLEIQQEIGDKSGEGTTLNNISAIYNARGDYETALSYLKQSLEIRQEIGDKSGEGTTLNNISQIYDARGDYETALSYLKESLEIRQEIGDNAGMCATLFNMGHIQLQNKQKEKALKTWGQVYALAKPMQLAQALEALEGLAEQLGLDDGLVSWEKFMPEGDE